MLIEFLSRTSEIGTEELLRLSETASRRYKVYEIPKRTGGKRTIEHPSRELKAIQRWIVRALFSRFPVHEAATAYRKGSGIRENAERHRHSRFTNRYDFISFFPSFKQERVESFLRGESIKLGILLTDADVRFAGNIVCRNGQLTIGAPSSPAIINTMMFAFDAALYERCAPKGLIYTRYADDIFISANGPNELLGLEDEIRIAKRDISHLNLRVNRKKTTYLSKKYARRITGVVITPEQKLSIGRERKREIKSLIHRWTIGRLEIDKLSYMRGLVAFARDVEPEFEIRIRKKYGDRIIDKILHSPILELYSIDELK